MMTTTKELSKEQGIAIIRWYDSKSENWGSWGNYPVLGLGASYLQYDTNPCQINLDIPVMINGEKYNCISCGRSVGKKWSNFISFSELRGWCLREEQEKIEQTRRDAMLAGYNNALSAFNSLPENLRTELLSITEASCGSNNRRKKAIGVYVGEHAEEILPIIDSKSVRQIIDCLQYNHTYFSI